MGLVFIANINTIEMRTMDPIIRFVFNVDDQKDTISSGITRPGIILVDGNKSDIFFDKKSNKAINANAADNNTTIIFSLLIE